MIPVYHWRFGNAILGGINVRFENKVTGTIIEAYAEMAEYYSKNISWREIEDKKKGGYVIENIKCIDERI